MRPALIAVAAVLVVALVGGGAALAISHGSSSTTVCGQQVKIAHPAPTATPGIPAGFTQFRDQFDVYSLQLPGDWQQIVQAGVTTVQFVKFPTRVDTSPGDVLRFTIDLYSGTCPSLQSYVQSPFMGPVSNKQGPSGIQLAGEAWAQESLDTTYAYTPTHEVYMETQFESQTQHELVGVVIDYSAPISEFAAIYAQDFQPMLASFYFVS